MSGLVIVIGGGGHAAVVIDALLLAGFEVVGLCDPELEPGGTGPSGITVLGGDDALDRWPPDTTLLANGVGSTRSTETRRNVFERFTRAGFRFATLIHPSAVVAKDVALGEGAQVMAGAVVQPGVTLGRNSIVNTRASVDHHCVIGEHVHIAPGATLSGNVEVGEGSHIGTGASIVQRIQIGRDALVCAGAVVTRDVADGAKVAVATVVHDAVRQRELLS